MASKAKKAPVISTVKMEDGREVRFAGARTNLVKEILIYGKAIDEATPATIESAGVGDIAVRLDFRNGVTRTYPLNPALMIQFAAQGGLTKYGAALANEPAGDVTSWPAATDKLHERLQAGQWSVVRGDGKAASKAVGVLALALVEFTGTPLDAVRTNLKSMTAAQRKALAQDDRIRPIIERLERERAAPVDTDSLLSRFNTEAQAA